MKKVYVVLEWVVKEDEEKQVREILRNLSDTETTGVQSVTIFYSGHPDTMKLMDLLEKT